MKLAERIKQTRKEIVQKTCELVSIPTPVPPGENYEEAAGWLRDFLEECGARVQLINAPSHLSRTVETELSGPRVNVIGEYDLGEGPSILVAGHYDVVPVKEGEWATPPFVGGSPGALDACYSVREGIPTVTFGAGGAESNSHGSNESVRIEDLVTYAQIVSLSLCEYLET